MKMCAHPEPLLRPITCGHVAFVSALSSAQPSPPTMQQSPGKKLGQDFSERSLGHLQSVAGYRKLQILQM